MNSQQSTNTVRVVKNRQAPKTSDRTREKIRCSEEVKRKIAQAAKDIMWL